MNTSKLIAAAVIRLSLVAGAAWAGQGASASHLAADAHRTIGHTAQPEPMLASIAQLLAQ